MAFVRRLPIKIRSAEPIEPENTEPMQNRF